jgi:hypothetical protein
MTPEELVDLLVDWLVGVHPQTRAMTTARAAATGMINRLSRLKLQ